MINGQVYSSSGRPSSTSAVARTPTTAVKVSYGTNTLEFGQDGKVTLNGRPIGEDSSSVKVSVYERNLPLQVTVSGGAGDVTSTNAPITVTGPTGAVQTSNGSVTVNGDVTGNATTSNGTIRITGSCGGKATTTNGSVHIGR